MKHVHVWREQRAWKTHTRTRVKMTRHLHVCLKETNERVKNEARSTLPPDSKTLFIGVTLRGKIFNYGPKELQTRTASRSEHCSETLFMQEYVNKCDSVSRKGRYDGAEMFSTKIVKSRNGK